MTERKDIAVRLENWAKWVSAGSLRRGGGECMTGVVCERMRRNALGDVWSGHEVREPTDHDPVDAKRIQQAMPHIELRHRFMLQYTYVNGHPPEMVCRLLRIPVRPISEFVKAFRDAQTAIEKVIDGAQKR